jgi:hypothetical protein
MMLPQPSPVPSGGVPPSPSPPTGNLPQTPQPAAQPSPQTLPAGAPITIDAVMRLLRDNASRRFRMDIEADSTIAGDEAQEKKDRTELVEVITKMVETWGPIVAAQPAMAQLAGDLMLFALRAYKVGRTLETTIETMVTQMVEKAGQPKPPPQPNPDELIKLEGQKAKTAAEIAKAKIGVQEAQIDAQASMADHHVDAQARQQDAALSAQEHGQDMQALQVQGDQAAADAMRKEQLQRMRFDSAVDREKYPGEDKK